MAVLVFQGRICHWGRPFRVAVLGCAPGEVLDLDWKPLLRDTTFYVLAIVLLVVCLWDGEVWWQEALVMFVRAADRAGISVQLFVGVNKLWADHLNGCVKAALDFVRRERLHPLHVVDEVHTSKHESS